MSENRPPDSQSSYHADEDGGITIDFARLLDALRKYFWIVLLFLITGVVAAVAYLNVATPIYQSNTLIKIEQRVADAAPMMSARGMSDGGQEDLRALEMLATIQRGFLSRSLMEQVCAKLDLENRAGFLPKGIPADEKHEAAIKLLAKNTDSQVVRGTRLLQLTFEHPSPEIATEIVGALVREYIALDMDQRLKSASGTLDYLTRERSRLENQLRDSEEKLSAYTLKLGSVSVDSEMNIIAEQLKELNTRLTIAKTDRLKLEADYNQIEKVSNDPDTLLQIQSISELKEIETLRTQLNDFDGQISRTRQRYGPKSPQLAELVSQRSGLKDALYAEALRAPRSVEISLRAAAQNEKSLEKETESQEHKTLEVQSLAIQSSVLQRQIDADKIAFQAVLQSLNEEQSQARSQAIFLQVVDPASPAIQVKPRPLLVSAIALVLALGGSLGAIFIIAMLDTSFKSADEAEIALGTHVIAAVPQHVQTNRKKGRSQDSEKSSVELLPTLDDHHSTVSEAFRTLRASLMMVEKEKHLILVTSAIPGEGKSFCSINLAVALAAEGIPTLIVDADLRKPVVEQRLYGSRKNVPGVTDYLMGRVDLDEIIQETHVPNLFAITAGRHYSNPSELLLRRERFREFLSAIDGKFRRVVFDTAPVLAVSDTINISRYFKTIALVVRSHKTPRRLAQRAVDLLGRGGSPITGAVLNLVPARGSSYYYYYNYGQGGQSYGAPGPQATKQTG